MHCIRFHLLVPALAAGLVLTGCGRSAKEQAKTPPAPGPVVLAPKPEPAPAPAAEPARVRRSAKPAPKIEEMESARIEGGYMTVLFKNGRRGLFPLADLTAADEEAMKAFAAAHPLAKGKSSVVMAKVEVKKTIAKQVTEDGTEIVQLVTPAKLRDQIGPTCMFYARVHYLDIAGYPIEDGEIYRVINTVSPKEPYLDYRYHVGMQMLFLRMKPTPLAHFPDGTVPPFEWARQQLRKGRVILAALPENIWLTLPADFLATHPFEGNSKIGHQVVISGFTHNPATKKSTFHIVNSWRALSEFDVTVEPRDERNIVMEQSLSPRGELPEQPPKVVAGAITLVRPMGRQNLYSVETNLGPQRVMAASEEAAKQFVELDTSAKDLDAIFGEYVIRIYDYIHLYADAKVRDAAAAALLAEVFRIPANVALPHVDFEVKGALGKTYFVRIAPEKVVKLMADSPTEALEHARRMPGARP